MNQQKKTVKDYLDNVFSDEGLKSDITVSLTDQSLLKASAYLTGTALVIILMVFGAKEIFKHKA